MKIVVCTFNRSEYGPLRSLIKELKKDPFFDIKIVAGGAHLSVAHGYTRNEILQDEITIDLELDYLTEDCDPFDLVRDSSKILFMFPQFLEKERPDACLVLGDRYELLPVAFTCLISSVPILHISGGEITEGAVDNQVRAALSKMASLHFVSNEGARLNLLKMAEEPWRVCVSGEPALDYISSMTRISKRELYADLRLNLDLDLILCTFHSETLSNNLGPEFIEALLLRIIGEHPNSQLLLTAANPDAGGTEINECIKRLGEKVPRLTFIPSLGQVRYYSLLNFVKLMIGNSSSGIIESKSFNIPVINIGSRQKGRWQNDNVLNAAIDIEDILQKMAQTQSEKFLGAIKGGVNIYGDGKSAGRIIPFLKKAFKERSVQEILIKKWQE